MEIYDVIIIGTGPAGLTAALYTARAKLSTLMVDKQTIGGELMNRDVIENFPGYPGGIPGPELASKMINQVTDHGVQIQLAEVQRIAASAEYKAVRTAQGDYLGRAVIIAGGARPRKLGVPGEQGLSEKGVFYCATCDGPRFADKAVAVAGGGDSGITEGLFLAKFVSKVIIIEALPALTATRILRERALSHPKIEIRCGCRIEAIRGDKVVEAIDLLDSTGNRSALKVDGVLVHIGVEPNTHYLKGFMPLNDKNQVPVNSCMETPVEGVFAAGDIRSDSPMQIATAVGDGAAAALSVQKFLAAGFSR